MFLVGFSELLAQGLRLGYWCYDPVPLVVFISAFHGLRIPFYRKTFKYKRVTYPLEAD